MNAPRRPELCQFRRAVPSNGEDRATCELATRLAGSGANGRLIVDRQVCDQCCRHPLPCGPRLNPVVASLVFSAANGANESFTLNVDDHVWNHHAQQFAMRWLATVGNGEARRSPSGDLVAGSFFSCSNDRAAEANSRPGEISSRLKIGLFGRHSAFGLGNVHRDMVVHLGIDRWLVCYFPGWGDEPPKDLPCRIDVLTHDPAPADLAAWLDGLDVVVFVETPVISGLPSIAKRRGVRVVCVPMWEYLHAGQEWLEEVDLMLCPTRCSAELLAQWKLRFGFQWQVAFVPWPLDTSRFRFRQRAVCRRFVFVNGSGGAPVIGRGDSSVRFRRKGLDVLLEAARLAPEIPIIVYSCAPLRCVPGNVELRRPPRVNSLLFCDGDVCVQPSHWEGLGLPLLECQAAGMPLVTTDSPPMNEHNPFALIPASEEAAYLSPQLCIAAAHIQPEDLANVLRSAHGRRIGRASRRARRFVEQEHNWSAARPRIMRALSEVVSAKAVLA